MAGMTALAIGGALAAGAGGAMQGAAQKGAAKDAARMAAYNPWGIYGAGGQVDASRGRFTVSPDEQMSAWSNMLQGLGLQNLSGQGFGANAMNFANDVGSGALMDAFGQSFAASDPTSAINAGNLFSQFSQQNALFGQQQGQRFLDMATGPGASESEIQRLFGTGFDALNNTDFSQLSANFIDRQRQLARPAEERAVNSKFSNLFNRGALSSSGGAQQIGALAEAQEMADLQRVNAGESFANMVQQQNRQFGLGSIAQAAGLRNMDNSMRSVYGSLGQGLLNFGQSAGQAGAGMQIGLNELINSRGQQRIANAQGLLGFGSGLQDAMINRGMGMFGGIRGINSDLRSLIALSQGSGADAAQAGARQGQFMMQGGISPFGAFLGGFGGGLSQVGLAGMA